ncbi:MAG: hypothetical protein MMC23_002846 [Stictis urceolatum]|nr:hypothetical protein [Stictis urceolata]
MDLWPLEVYKSVPSTDPADQPSPSSPKAETTNPKPRGRANSKSKSKSTLQPESSSQSYTKPEPKRESRLEPIPRPVSRIDPPSPDLNPDSTTRRSPIQFASSAPSLTNKSDSSSSDTLSSRRPSAQLARPLQRSDSPASDIRPENSILKPSDPTGRRPTSPPPPSTCTRRVAFDTFDNKDAADYSFTLQANHAGYTYTKNSRVFLCGIDENDYSEYALSWLLEELVDDGDQIVCFRVVDKKSKLTSEKNLSRGRYKREARKLMERIETKANADSDGRARSVSLVLEFAVGEVQKVIQRLIAVYEPASLVVGTRGKALDGFQGLLPGSVSKYCLQNSPVPVIVVRPGKKREKKKRKRRADPSRRGYVNMVERSGGAPMLQRIDTGMREGEKDDSAGEKEALAVARAIGLTTMEATFRASMVADTGRAKPRSRIDVVDEEEEDSSEEEEAVSLDAVLSQSLKKDPKPVSEGRDKGGDEDEAQGSGGSTTELA